MKGSQTEYNKIGKIILGRIDTGNIFPTNDCGMLANIAAEEKLYENGNLNLNQAAELVPVITEEMISTTQQELDVMSEYLTKKSIEIVRPAAVTENQKIETPSCSTSQFPVYCPRDIIINFRDLIIISPNLYQSRQDESYYYNEILTNETKNGRIVIDSPRPYLDMNDFNIESDAKYVLNTNKPVFEAANILIDGEHNAIYYQISHSGNQAGYLWLKDLIQKIYPDVTVYPLEVYNGTHLDTTISILNYETVALNPERVTDISRLPEPLRNRKHIFPDIIDTTMPNGLSSKWIGMNSLSISPTEMIVDSDQTAYIKQLEKHGFDVFPHKLSYSDVLEGGHHCTTSDLRRNESY